MNGKQAKRLRRALGLTKPTEATQSGLFVYAGQLHFRKRSNPEMNTYRRLKRRWKNGRFV